MLRWFFKANNAADFAVRWWGAWCMVSAALTWLVKSIERLHLTWPEAIAIGLAVGLAALLILSVIGLLSGLTFNLFFKGRPLAPAVTNGDRAPLGATMAGYNDAAVWAELGSTSAKISRLEERLIAAQNRIEGLIKRVSALAEDTGKAFQGRADLEVLSNRLKLEVLDKLVEDHASLARAQESNFSPGVGMMDTVRKGIGILVDTLAHHGVDRQVMADKRKELEAAVTGDAIYASIGEDEREKFATVEQKREWQVRKRYLEWLGVLLGNMKRDLEPKGTALRHVRLKV